MSSRAEIDSVLAQLLARGCSAPAGRHWHAFHLWLEAHGRGRSNKPPVPLILAASGASNAMKHERLREQLEWALKASILTEALEQLRQVPLDGWNRGPLDKWYEEYWP